MNKMSAKFLPLLALCVAVQCVRAAEPALADRTRLTFSEAWHIALRDNQKIIAAREAIDHAAAKHRVEKGNYSTDLTLRAGYAQQWDDVRTVRKEDTTRRRSNTESIGGTTLLESGTNNIPIGELKVTLPWWHKRSAALTARQAQVGIELAREEAAKVFWDVQLDVFTAYFDVVLAAKKLETEEKSAFVAEQRLKQVAGSFELGSASELSLTTERANSLTRRSTVMEARDTLADKRRALARVLGGGTRGGIAATDDLFSDGARPPASDGSGAVEAQIRMLELRIDQQQIELKKVKQFLFPMLSFRFGYTHIEEEYVQADVGSAGIFIEVPFPHPGQVKNQTALARLDLAALERQRNFEVIETNDELTYLKQKRRRVAERLETLSLVIGLSEKEAEAARKNFELGRITNLELQLVEERSTNTVNSHHQALYDQMVTLAKLRVMNREDLVSWQSARKRK